MLQGRGGEEADRSLPSQQCQQKKCVEKEKFLLYCVSLGLSMFNKTVKPKTTVINSFEEYTSFILNYFHIVQSQALQAKGV